MGSNITNNTSVTKIIPDYLSLDFNSFVSKEIEVLKSMNHFKDYNYEGSNIRLLLELIAYQSELNTYYLNQIAKNVFDDTAELYENKHRIAKLKGYNARGYISSKTDLKFTLEQFDRDGIRQFEIGDKLYIPDGKSIYATDLEDNENIVPFSIRFPTTIEILEDMLYIKNPETNSEEYDNKISFIVPIIQGEVMNFNYSGSDIIDNKLILPFYSFNHDISDNVEDSNLKLLINGEPWLRVSNFYDKISGLTENTQSNNVFQFLFDKFKRYVIEFSPTRNVPDKLSEINIQLLNSLGSLGNVGKNTITRLNTVKSSGIVYNLTKNKEVNLGVIKITNEKESSGGVDPQSTIDLTNAGKNNISSQERCVTKQDYISYLNARSDIIASNVWGEQDISPHGDIREYNKVHISIIPFNWYDKTISIEEDKWITEDTKEHKIFKPIKYSDEFKESIKTYLEPRKIITTYEVFDLPELIFFRFTIGLKLQRLSTFVDVSNTVKDKLNYFFDPVNQLFNNKISFMEIHNFILDTGISTFNKNWDLIKGIENLVFRKIEINLKPIPQEKIDFYSLPLSGGYYTIDGKEYYTDKGYDIEIKPGANIYPPNFEKDYPQYTRKEFMSFIENKMKVIWLGNNQFPVLLESIIEEEYV